MQKISTLVKLFLPRLNAVLFILLFLSAMTLGPKMLNIDGDLPRHLLMGKVIFERVVPPTQEIFSYVYEGRPYTPHEWGADVIYCSAYIFLGLNGVVLLASILIATAFGVLYSEATDQNAGKVLTFLLLIMGALVTSIHWVTRPHLFTMLFLAIWLILADRLYRGTPVKIWVFPALMLLWANIHAEFIAGFLVLIAYIAGWARQYLFARSNTVLETGKKLLSATLFSLVASTVNPAGFRTWDTVLGYVNNRYLLSHIAETRPPDFTQAEYWPLLLMLGISIFLLVTQKGKFTPAQFFLIAGFGTMSLLSARNAHLFGLAAPFILSIALKGTTNFWPLSTIEAALRQMESQISGTVLPVVLTILISAVAITGPLGKSNRFEPSIFPVDAVRWLEDHPQSGRMFNAFDWGGYILFYLWPEHKVFIESQTDVTGEVTQKYETIITLRHGWQEIFKEYDITWAIIPPQWPLAKELIAQGWESAYQDQTAIILHK